MSAPRMVGIIPARGGSKGIPEKNLAPLRGQPLIAFTIAAAADCSMLDAWVVSTDSERIAAASRSLGAKVIRRPPELSRDDSPTAPVVVHAIEHLRREGLFFEQYALLQPTSPLRNASDLKRSIVEFRSRRAKSLISVTTAEHHPYKMFTLDDDDELRPLFDRDRLHVPRQSLPAALRQNGAIYLGEVDAFLAERSFFLPPCIPFIMAPEQSVDLDSPADLKVADEVLRRLSETAMNPHE